MLTAFRCPIQTVPQPSAVFDLHFSPLPDQGDVCAAVSSTGTISFFRLCPDADDRTVAKTDVLQPLSVLRIPDLGEDVLFTYFAWHPTIRGLIAVTTASGTVILVQAHADYQGLDVLEESVLEHSLEAWVTAFSPPSLELESAGEQHQRHPFTIFSGGDDSALKYTTWHPSSPSKPTQSSSSGITQDQDEEEEEEEEPHNHTPFPALTLRGHNAGVTSILPFHLPAAHRHHGHGRHPPALLLTGSYDDTLRIYAIPPAPHPPHGAQQRPRLLADKNLGGGVWRLGLLGPPIADANGDAGAWAATVLASCMHAGARVVRIRGRAGGGDGAAAVEVQVEEVEVLARFEEHASMNYGSDWSRTESRLWAPSGTAEGEKDGEVLCVSTSFYDRLLCVWRCALPAL